MPDFPRRRFLGVALGIGAAAGLKGLSQVRVDSNHSSAERCVDVGALGVPRDGSTNVTDAVQRAADELAEQGGGVLYFPPGTYPLSLQVPDGVLVLGTEETILQAANARSVVVLVGRNCGIRDVRVVGSHPDDPGRGRAAYCIELRGREMVVDRVISGGARFDSLYIRCEGDVVVTNSEFRPSARNTCSVVKGVGIHFQDCSFHQDGSVSSQNLSGLYLYDIEPNRGDEVYDVSHIRCTYQNDLRDGYASVLLHAGANRTTGDNSVLFYRCQFLRGRHVTAVIRISKGEVYRGLTLVENEFAGGVLTNDRPIRLSRSELIRNRHGGSRFGFNVRLDDVVVVGHRGGGWTGFHTTEETVVSDLSPER